MRSGIIFKSQVCLENSHHHGALVNSFCVPIVMRRCKYFFDSESRPHAFPAIHNLSSQKINPFDPALRDRVGPSLFFGTSGANHRSRAFLLSSVVVVPGWPTQRASTGPHTVPLFWPQICISARDQFPQMLRQPQWLDFLGASRSDSQAGLSSVATDALRLNIAEALR